MNGKWVRGLISRVLFTAVRKKAVAADMNWDEVLTAALKNWVREQDPAGPPARTE